MPQFRAVDRADITTGLVRRLIAEQFPEWSRLSVRQVDANGWDNSTFRLGDTMSVRMPTGDSYSKQVEKEQRWLPVLAPYLPQPIPVPLAQGAPG
jgi:aminoglycoside phosphotransferase (APT) family kinase protein